MRGKARSSFAKSRLWIEIFWVFGKFAVIPIRRILGPKTGSRRARLKDRPSFPDMRTIYFDYNATTPLDPAVRNAMLPYMDQVWGNPSSVHHVGQKARAALDDARDRASIVLGCKPSEVIFTS